MHAAIADQIAKLPDTDSEVRETLELFQLLIAVRGRAELDQAGHTVAKGALSSLVDDTFIQGEINRITMRDHTDPESGARLGSDEYKFGPYIASTKDGEVYYPNGVMVYTLPTDTS